VFLKSTPPLHCTTDRLLHTFLNPVTEIPDKIFIYYQRTKHKATRKIQTTLRWRVGT